MNLTKVKPPKFRVGRYILNEYELRTLMLEVKQGLKPENIKVKACTFPYGEAIINNNGTLSRKLPGLDILGALTLELLKG